MTTPQQDAETRHWELIDTLRALLEPIGALVKNGSMVLTRSIVGRGHSFADQCVKTVRQFDDAMSDIDPPNEYEFTFLEVAGESIFVKVDYYDFQPSRHWPDASDFAVTRRVLTISLADA